MINVASKITGEKIAILISNVRHLDSHIVKYKKFHSVCINKLQIVQRESRTSGYGGIKKLTYLFLLKISIKLEKKV